MIPDYQTLMRPLLECIQDGQEHLFKNVIEQLADRFELTREEREQLAPSGHRALFSGRVGWAKTYLKKAGLLEQRKRGILSITSLGIKALKSKKKIDVTYLTETKESTVSSRRTSWVWTSSISRPRNGTGTIQSDVPNCKNSWVHSPDREVRKGFLSPLPLSPKRRNPTNPRESNWSKSTERN